MPLTLVTSRRFADHLTPPGHPECVQRAEVMQQVTGAARHHGLTVVEPRPAPLEAIGRVHTDAYVARIRETAGRAAALDADTFTSPESSDVARLAAGAALMAVDTVLDGAAGQRALALVRPPGHHAERDRAMGFCLYNNIAIAAAHARSRGVARVAILDYDVHHGNGTQQAFEDDPTVLFVSSHQYPYYPGTGGPHEVGRGAGAGFTVNIPLAAGATDADCELAYASIVWPILRQFRPELLLLSAGFDGLADDPLGGWRLSVEQVARLTALAAELADEVCGGRVAAVTEGGYDPDGLQAALHAVVAVLDGQVAVTDLPSPDGPAPRGRATVEAVTPHLSRYWTL